MSAPHLIALDVDGTIVDYNDTLSPVVRGAVGAARAAGHHIVIATGRSAVGTVPVIRELGLTTGFAVCGNGSVLLRLDPSLPEGWEVDEVITFDPGPALKQLYRVAPDSVFMLEDENLKRWVTAPFPENELTGDSEQTTFEDLLTKEATRIVMRDPNRTAEQFDEIVDSLGLQGVGYSVGWTAWLDIAPEGVSKASALETVRKRLGVPASDTFAVGDGSNDVEMIGWAACGVAMGNAAESLRRVADEVTGSVEDDGLAQALRRFAR